MARTTMPWFRFYTETIWDRKLRRQSVEVRWLWVAVLSAARESPIPGSLMVSVQQPMVEEDIADAAALEVGVVRSGLCSLEAVGVLERDVNLGCWIVSRWHSRQYESDCSTDRTRTFRERSQKQNQNAPETEGGPRKRGTRIPDVFEITDEMREWAERECPTVNRREETSKFVDHFKSASGANASKLDWPRAWKNWMRRARDGFR